MDKFEALHRIMLATNRIDGLYYLFAKRCRVNENTLAFLYAMNDGEAHSQKEISEAWIIPRTTISSIVKKMEREGCLRFLPESHGKEKAMRLTKKGEALAYELLAKIYATEEKAIEKTLAHYSPEFIEALEDFADRLHEEMQKTEKEHT